MDDLSIKILREKASKVLKFKNGVVEGIIDKGEKSKKLYIPAKINGKKVIKIKEYAFYHNDFIEEIIIEDGIELIEDCAFSCCGAKSVSIPGSVKRISRCAFSYCKNLESVTLGNGIGLIYPNAFEGCKNIKYNEDDYAYYLGDEENPYLLLAKVKDKNIKSFEIKKETKAIGDSAFSASSIESITVPSNVTSVGSNSFFECMLLKSVILEDGVELIGDDAFQGCQRLSDIRLPKTLNEIGGQAFWYCYSLMSIVIPESVLEIGEFIFWFCDKLLDVYNLSRCSLDEAFDKEIPKIRKELGSSSALLQGDFVFAKKNETYYLMGYNGNDKEIVLPDNYNGNIYEIHKHAFTYNGDVTKITIPEGIDVVGEYAFAVCSSLKEVSLPTTIQSLGFSAFRNCSSLKSIKLPQSIKKIETGMFFGCISLQEVSLSQELIRIDKMAFYNCSSLKTIDIPSTVEEVASDAFQDCASLMRDKDGAAYIGNAKIPNMILVDIDNSNITDYKVKNGTKMICDSAFKKCTSIKNLTMPNSVVSIGKFMCLGLEKLESVVLSDKIRKTPMSSFENCKSLVNVRLPRMLKEIDTMTFEGCTSLENVILPKGLAKIDTAGFENCTSLVSVEMPSRMSKIGTAAFKGCTSLKSITIPKGISEMEMSAFADCTSLESITLSSDTTKFAYSSFENCSALKDVYFQGTIKQWCAYPNDWLPKKQGSPLSLGANLYINGEKVENLFIPKTVKAVEGKAFCGCTSIKTVRLERGVTEIGKEAFENCVNLTQVYIPKTVKTIKAKVFEGCTNLKLIMCEHEKMPCCDWEDDMYDCFDIIKWGCKE